MIILNILLVFLTGLGLLWIFDQHKYLNIFEQLAFGFGVALSLFVFELFIQGIVFNHLSLILPIITFIAVIGTLIYKNSKNKTLFSEIGLSIKDNFIQIKDNFVSSKQWQKGVIVLALIYCLFKVFMVFSINTNMPTFDEDAVTGWDLQTKVLLENSSLNLDKNSPEYMGTNFDSGRSLFSALSDYLLLSSNNVVITNSTNLTNIISPIIYILIGILIFGSIIHLSNLFYGILSLYFYLSANFLFIHGFASYTNLIHGFYFLSSFYVIYLGFKIKSLNLFWLFSYLLVPLVWVRKEGIIFYFFFSLFFIIYAAFIDKNYKFKNLVKFIVPGLISYIGFYLFYRIYAINPLTQVTKAPIKVGTIQIAGFDLNISNFSFESISLIIHQLFQRPEFSLIPISLLLLTIFSVIKKQKINIFFGLFLFGIILAFIIFLTVWGGVEGNMGFVGIARYGIVLIPSFVLLMTIMFYDLFNQKPGK